MELTNLYTNCGPWPWAGMPGVGPPLSPALHNPTEQQFDDGDSAYGVGGNEVNIRNSRYG